MLKTKIDEAFTVFGFQHESLEGTVGRKNRAVTNFQKDCTGKQAEITRRGMKRLELSGEGNVFKRPAPDPLIE